MDARAKKLILLGVVSFLVYVVSLLVPDGSFMILAGLNNAGTQGGINGLIESFTSKVNILSAWTTSGGEAPTRLLSHSLMVYLAGCGLALSGAIYQGSFRNALVSPSTLGVMTGSQLGLYIWVVLFIGVLPSLGITSLDGYSDNLFLQIFGGTTIQGSSIGLPLMSFLGCMLVVCLVLLILKFIGNGNTGGILLIICGQVIAGVISTALSLITYYYATVDPDGQVIQYLRELAVSSFYREYSWFDIGITFVLLAVTFVVVMRLRQKMMMLSFDETEQRTMGIQTNRIKNAVVVLCTLLTAVIISFCGVVSFVGFFVPHLARRLTGPNFKYLLPASMLLGGIFVLGAYTCVIGILGSFYKELTGMFISIFGSIVFLVTVLRGKGGRLGSFGK